MSEIFIGRQPIYDRDLVVYAYELLYRASTGDAANVVDDDRATSHVIMNTLTEFGLEKLVGDNLAFINLPKSFIVGDYPIPLSKTQSVLEVLEDIAVDEQVLAAVKKLGDEGFTIALDDFRYLDELRPLIALAKIVKVDILGMDRDTIKFNYDKLRPFGVKLLAEKVETQEEFEFTKQLGFDYFQGYFFCRPNILKKTSVPPNRLVILNLLAQLHTPNADLKKIAELVSNDVAISYKILRFINSAAIGLPKKIESIHQAVIYLGIKNVTNLASLIAMSNIDDKPTELIVTAILRAKMCEQLGAMSGAARETYFTIGLFSALDALMDMPMGEALAALPLIQEIKHALLGQPCQERDALQCVINYERGNWDEVKFANLDANDISKAYLDAVSWTDQVIQQVN